MKEVFLFVFMLVSFTAFAQSACRGVIIGERTSMTYAQSYLESLREKSTNNDGQVSLPITDTFHLVDYCVVDSVVIVELDNTKNNNNTAHDTTLFFSNRYYLLSKIDSIPSNGECLEVGKDYYLTITPYYSRGYFVSLGGPGMPIILNKTAYKIWFVGNIYFSSDIQGVYYVFQTQMDMRPKIAPAKTMVKQ